MKKLAATLLTFLISGSAFALPIGNPWEASIMCDGICWEGNCGDYCDPCLSLCDAWSFRFGFYGDYVFNHDMNCDTCEGKPTIHDVEFYTNAGYLAFNLWDRVDLFATLGATRIYIETNLGFIRPGDNARDFLETDTSFSWSVGGRGTIWECGCLGVGIEGQYFRSKPDINFVREENNSSVYMNGEKLKYHEWQVGLGAAYRINIAYCSTALIPYIGIKWNRAWLEDIDQDDFKSNRYFGYAIGATLLGCNKGSITVEGRFLNEKAVYVNGQVRF